MVAAVRRMSAPDRPDEDLQRVADHRGHLAADLGGDADERGAQPVAPEERPVLGRKCRQRDDRDRHVEHDDEPDGPEQAPGEVAARPPRLLGQIGHGLEAGVCQHRERKRERDRVPGRRLTERGSGREGVWREEEGHPEHDEQELGREVDERDDQRPAMQSRAMDQAYGGDAGDDAAADDHVPGALDLREECPGNVVRDEESRERDHDQVVEKQDPAGGEAPKVVERNPNERRCAAGLADRRRSFRVREGDDQEQEPRREQHRGGEAERVQRDDPEREVDRGGDLAIRDREERRSVEDPLETGQLASHQCPFR